MANATTITARWIAVPNGEVRESAWLEIADGQILAIDDRRGRHADHDFGDAVILPGLVNAHTHLDLTGALGKTPPCLTFPDWLRDVIAFRREQPLAEMMNEVSRGIRQSLAAGTTLVGDIAAEAVTWDALRSSPLKAVVFHEMLGLTAERAQAAVEAAKDWLQEHKLTTQVRPGVSPHAPYSFRFDRLAELVAWKVPIAIHFAESLDELELIAEHDGEFVPFLEELGVWDPTGLPILDGGAHPLQGAQNLILVHCNYLPAEASIPAGATVVYCPRTHAAFDHDPHPFREWLKRDIRVALGTDSLASNPDLSTLSEARFVFAEQPDIDPLTLLHMITRNGAEALGFDRECGSLAIGLAADLCVVELPESTTSDPLRAVFSGETPVRAVFIDGKRVV